ncbi:MAG: DEAD/DEAH box helicase [Psychrobium sp.]|nr:DEAD/DEAH box helicase [Psychrobium sp.]
MSFADLGLCPQILEAVAEQGYETPSPIQAEAIPAVLAGKDVMAAAQTGTGKTAAFTLPILEMLRRGQQAQNNQVRALILTPTRELAAQIAENVATYSKNLPLKSTVVFGGVKINPQMQKLRQGADVLIATPGRLMDLYNQRAIRFDQLEVLVLDEADRMLDMGFIHDIRRIIKFLPTKRQNLMFSATFSDDIRRLAKGMINNPVEVSVTPPNSTVDRIKQWMVPLDKAKKSAVLSFLIEDNDWKQVLVFTRTKHGANRLTKNLEAKGHSAAAIHGNKSQGARTKALAGFKDGTIKILVATDIAARGLDIDHLPHVVNFDLPNVAEDYVHRIGRTGRAGKSGEAVSLVSNDEMDQLKDIERLIKQLIDRVEIPGFEALHRVPETELDTRPIKAKRAKSPKASHHDGQRSAENSRGHKPKSANTRHKANGSSNTSSRNSNGNKSASNQGQGNESNKRSNGQRRNPNS